MELKAIRDQVIVQRLTEDREGSIILPTERESLLAKVCAVGPKATLVKVGMIVLVRETVGHELTFSAGGEPLRYVILDESQIDAIVEGDL